jgi:N,N'-diacetyllegionaminate synthase
VTQVRLGARPVGGDAPTYIIAEIGSNHDGVLDEALRLIEAAAAAGADCVKAQSYRADRLVAPDHPGHATLDRLSLPRSWYPKLKQVAERAGVHFASTPFDLEAVADLAELGVPFLKVASGDLTYTDLLVAVARTGLPVIISTGAAYVGEIEETVHLLREAGAAELAILHCVSAYPTAFDGTNLRAIATLRDRFAVPIGFSDHTPGHAATLAAVALGARIIEKHVTFDRTRPGPDHAFALEMDELAALVRDVRAVEAALGDGEKVPLAAERDEREGARRAVYAARALEGGHKLTTDDLVCLRPARGIPAARRQELVGRRLGRAVPAGAPLQEEDL